MPKLTNSPPKYRKHRASGKAVVTIHGQDHYLGPYGTKASRLEYDRVIAEWLAKGRYLPHGMPASDLTVVELVAAYLDWAKAYYQGGSREVENIDLAFRPLLELYKRTPAVEFGPLALKAVRQKMIEADLCRKHINQRIGRIKRLFKWGVENELVPPSVFHGLQAVVGLARGRSEARESEPVRPVPDAFVDAIRDFVVPQVWAMIELQRVTGMRPGEVTIMRTADLDTSGQTWVYKPKKHKTEHHGHQREIYLGPKAQEILKPWLRTDLEAYLFQPREAVNWLRKQRTAARKTPLSCGNRPGTNRKRKPKKAPGDVYLVRAYHAAIRIACQKAGVAHWHPHQLRHNAATRLRKEYGLDVARCVLGHRSAAITEVYAEADFEKSKQVMGQIG